MQTTWLFSPRREMGFKFTRCRVRKWNLEINCEKTKCMTFSKGGRLHKHVFTVSNRPIDHVQSY